MILWFQTFARTVGWSHDVAWLSFHKKSFGIFWSNHTEFITYELWVGWNKSASPVWSNECKREKHVHMTRHIAAMCSGVGTISIALRCQLTLHFAPQRYFKRQTQFVYRLVSIFAIFASKHGSSSQKSWNAKTAQKIIKTSKNIHKKTMACPMPVLNIFGVTLPHELDRTCWWRFATPQRSAAGHPPRSERRAPGRRPTASARNPPQRDATKKTKQTSKTRVTDLQISSLKCFGKRHDLWIGLQIYTQNVSNMAWWFKRCLTSMKHTNTYPAYF